MELVLCCHTAGQQRAKMKFFLYPVNNSRLEYLKNDGKNIICNTRMFGQESQVIPSSNLTLHTVLLAASILIQMKVII